MCMKLLAEDNMLQLVNINFDTIIFTLINTLIIFLLYKFLLHNKVMAVLDERKEKVNSEMKAAEAAQAEAEAVKKEYSERLEQSKEEASQIVAAAVKRAGEREAEIIAQANAEAAAIKVKAEESIELEKKKAINEIKDQIADIVIMASERSARRKFPPRKTKRLLISLSLK